MRAVYGTFHCIFTLVGIQSPGRSGSEKSLEFLGIVGSLVAYLRTMVQIAFQ